MKKPFLFRVLTPVLLALPLCAFGGRTITGRVINATSNKPSGGDEVLLLRLGEGMQEESRAVSDVSGNFSLPLLAPEASHVVRVVHQGVNYDQRLSAATPFEVRVFDAAPRVAGLGARVGMAQIEPDGANFKITEMYDIANVSQPPVTQGGTQNFVFSLPSGATLDSFQAKKMDGVWVNLYPVRVKGKADRLAVDFPMRPGDTLFRYVYHLPGDKVTSFKLEPAYPVSNFAVVHAPSVLFKAVHTGDFTSPGVAKGLRLEQVVTKAPLRQIPAFEISGVGAATAAPVDLASGSASRAAAIDSPAAHKSAIGTSLITRDSSGGIWPVFVALGCLLATLVLANWRRKRQNSAVSEHGNAG